FWPPSHPASVVVEIGPGHGALVLYAAQELLGTEVEICPDSDPAVRTHTAIRERHLPDGIVCAALFGSLPVGLYRVTGTDQLIWVIEGIVSEGILDQQG
ncbi:MAG: hypothetical protein ACYCTI_08025, partial [Acidimicrobiales bacterium]